MSAADASKLEGGNVRLSVGGDAPAAARVVGEPKRATTELVDLVTEATWNEALRRLGGLPSNPLPLWTLLAGRILRAVADGERDPQRLERFALAGLIDDDGFGKGHGF